MYSMCISCYNVDIMYTRLKGRPIHCNGFELIKKQKHAGREFGKIVHWTG